MKAVGGRFGKAKEVPTELPQRIALAEPECSSRLDFCFRCRDRECPRHGYKAIRFATPQFKLYGNPRYHRRDGLGILLGPGNALPLSRPPYQVRTSVRLVEEQDLEHCLMTGST